jgi:hypothetical protein
MCSPQLIKSIPNNLEVATGIAMAGLTDAQHRKQVA